MACACRSKKEELNASTTSEGVEEVAIAEAADVDLKQCYLCARKHLSRAQIFFEEYHTGYPNHIKNLIIDNQHQQHSIL